MGQAIGGATTGDVPLLHPVPGAPDEWAWHYMCQHRAEAPLAPATAVLQGCMDRG